MSALEAALTPTLSRKARERELSVPFLLPLPFFTGEGRGEGAKP